MALAYLLTPTGELLDVIDECVEVEWTRPSLTSGSFILTMAQKDYDPNIMQKGNLFVPTEEVKSGYYSVYRIEQIELNVNASGGDSELLHLSGRSVSGILEERLCLPPLGLSHDEQKGPIETVMKHYVETNAGSLASTERQLKGLKIMPDQGRGPHVYMQARYQPVQAVLNALGQLYGVGWEVLLEADTGEFVFDVLFGDDHTENSANPVYFDDKYGNIIEQILISSDLERKSFAYVGGDGEGADRRIVSRYRTEAMGNNSDLFIVENSQADFQRGTLVDVVAHETGTLQLPQASSAASFVEDTPEDFAEGELQEVVATSAGGLELMTRTYDKYIYQFEDFEDGVINLRNHRVLDNGVEVPPMSVLEIIDETTPTGGTKVLTRIDSNDGLVFIFDETIPPDAFNASFSMYVANDSGDGTAAYHDVDITIHNRTTGAQEEYLVAPDFGKYEVLGWQKYVFPIDDMAQYSSPEIEVRISISGNYLRFDDMRIEYEQTVTEFPADGQGHRYSEAYQLPSCNCEDPQGSRSSISWDVIKPVGTNVRVYTALNLDPNTRPPDYEFEEVQNGGPIPRVDTAYADGACLWIKEVLISDSPDKTPTLNSVTVALDQMYTPSGYRDMPAIDLTSVGTATTSQIEWVADLDEGTFINIEASLDGTNWTSCINGSDIPVITSGMDLTGKQLYIRQNLHTDDETTTPVLVSMNAMFNVGVYPEPEDYNRKELFVDASDLVGSVALSLRGDSKLAETIVEDAFETTISPWGTFEYLKDWNLNDIVVVSNERWNKVADTRVISITRKISQGKNETMVELGKPQPTLKANLQRQIDKGVVSYN